MPKTKVTAEDLHAKWMQAYRENRNAAWVARQLDMSHQALHDRVANMRKRGVKLPALPKYNSGEGERLNKLNEVMT